MPLTMGVWKWISTTLYRRIKWTSTPTTITLDPCMAVRSDIAATTGDGAFKNLGQATCLSDILQRTIRQIGRCGLNDLWLNICIVSKALKMKSFQSNSCLSWSMSNWTWTHPTPTMSLHAKSSVWNSMQKYRATAGYSDWQKRQPGLAPHQARQDWLPSLYHSHCGWVLVVLCGIRAFGYYMERSRPEKSTEHKDTWHAACYWVHVSHQHAGARTVGYQSRCTTTDSYNFRPSAHRHTLAH